MIEINANPHRLDLDAVHCRHARDKGVKIVINPDAHCRRRPRGPGLRDLGGPTRMAREGRRLEHTPPEVDAPTDSRASWPAMRTSRIPTGAGLDGLCGGAGDL